MEGYMRRTTPQWIGCWPAAQNNYCQFSFAWLDTVYLVQQPNRAQTLSHLGVQDCEPNCHWQVNPSLQKRDDLCSTTWSCDHKYILHDHDNDADMVSSGTKTACRDLNNKQQEAANSSELPLYHEESCS